MYLLYYLQYTGHTNIVISWSCVNGKERNLGIWTPKVSDILRSWSNLGVGSQHTLADSCAVTVPNIKLTKILTRNSILQIQKDTNQRVNVSNLFHNLLPIFHENDVPKHNTSEKSSTFFQVIVQKAHFCLLCKFTTLTETDSEFSESKYAIPDLQVYIILKNLVQNNFSYRNLHAEILGFPNKHYENSCELLSEKSHIYVFLPFKRVHKLEITNKNKHFDHFKTLKTHQKT